MTTKGITKVWYIMDDPPCSGHKVYIPAEIVAEEGWIITVQCLTRPLRPRLDMRIAEDRRRIEDRLELSESE